MSESDGEQAARSVALEQAYVHEVYEQCAENTAQSRHWPRIYQFLEELEPGALVCDVGCGNGKYLSVNESVFKVGVDRCKRLTDISREKENEVLICDNLSLPFRDDSFDAVLSIAVVHHFATTERRVRALKELARVLRIGGRLVISVWAMEQRHRKFESQDVLVPWPRAYCVGSSMRAATSSSIPYADEMQHNQNASKDFLMSKRNSRKRCAGKSYWIDPVFSPSPSTSSLSSPNETCYSFVRRALQKLAGGKRGGPANRPWFLETWSHTAAKERRRIQQQDSGDVDDLPIELRRLEDINLTLNKLPDTLSIKSKSFGDILEIQRLNLVRSRSSIPGLCSTLTSETCLDDTSENLSLSNSKPKLVKQKSHLPEIDSLKIAETTANEELIKDLPDVQTAPKCPVKRCNVYKQNSMNEELMSIDRLMEKERVRKNIMKQTSLNEDIMYERKTFEAFKDSLCSGNATKRFQLLKSGLTSRIKQSTTNIEKVSGMSIKNGFVKILQWTSGENKQEEEVEEQASASAPREQISPKLKPTEKATTSIKKDAETIERRLSREDGSDSSKDSSLQSDTSIDSEDSFASVIYVPKQDMPSIIDTISTPLGYQLSATSAPPSPRVKHPPDLMGPRLKLIPMSPLLKQFPAASKSLPPTSPPGLSPRTLNSIPPRPFFGAFYNHPQSSVFDKFIRSKEIEIGLNNSTPSAPPPNQQSTAAKSSPAVETKLDKSEIQEQKAVDLPPAVVNEPPESLSQSANSEKKAAKVEPTVLSRVTEPSTLHGKYFEKSSVEITNEDERRKAQLNQIKELLKQKPGFATRCAKPAFPLVRRASAAATPGRLEMVTRPLPRLLSLELFNPETDDLDSDSSGVSSPESAGSMISVISDERFSANKGNVNEDGKEQEASQNSSDKSRESTTKNSECELWEHSNAYELLPSRSTSGSSTETSEASSQSLRLLEAAANVASSLEDAVGTAIQQKSVADSQRNPNSTNTKDKTPAYAGTWRDYASPSELQELLDDSKRKLLPLEESTWDEECQRHLIDFTEKLGENLIHDIGEYCAKTKHELNADVQCFGMESSVSRYKHQPGIDKTVTCKYSELMKTDNWTNDIIEETESCDIDNKPGDSLLGSECSSADSNKQTVINNLILPTSNSGDMMDFVLVSKDAEITNADKNRAAETASAKDPTAVTRSASGMTTYGDDVEKKRILQYDNSIESSDIGDSVENTSFSDFSQTESFRSSVTPEKPANGNAASLESVDAKHKYTRTKHKIDSQIRSASEEITSRPLLVRQQASINSECLLPTTSNATLTGSSSQESLPSDNGGGAIMYHQYYHVFREGELDQLINKYVENLHIISSYYDHASWCIVAEKVQVWTI